MGPDDSLPGVGQDPSVKADQKRAVLNRLKTSRGHLDAVIRMVEDETPCPEVMKQLSAVQGSLERASRIVLRNHLETCVASAMASGNAEEIVEDLVEALRYDRVATGPAAELAIPSDDVQS